MWEAMPKHGAGEKTKERLTFIGCEAKVGIGVDFGRMQFLCSFEGARVRFFVFVFVLFVFCDLWLVV